MCKTNESITKVKSSAEALEKRADCAYRFIHYDCLIAEWLEKKGLLDEVELYDIHGGCESYCNPDDSSNRIKAIIENA